MKRGDLERSGFIVGSQLLAAHRMAQFAQGFGLDLADTFAGDVEELAHLFQGVVALLANAETLAQDLLLAGVRSERTWAICSASLVLTTSSAGATAFLSSMKSPRLESSSSPMGVSREMGSLAIFKTFLTFSSG